MLIFFSREIVFLWQQNAETAYNVAPYVTLLTIGYAVNSFIFIPYALELSFGRTKLYFNILLVTFIVSVPSIILLATRFGAIGAAVSVIIFNVIPIVVLIPLMHLRILHDQMWKWIWQDVSLPLTGAAVIGFLGRYFFVYNTSQPIVIIQLGVIVSLTFGATLLMTKYSRNLILEKLPTI